MNNNAISEAFEEYLETVIGDDLHIFVKDVETVKMLFVEGAAAAAKAILENGQDQAGAIVREVISIAYDLAAIEKPSAKNANDLRHIESIPVTAYNATTGESFPASFGIPAFVDQPAKHRDEWEPKSVNYVALPFYVGSGKEQDETIFIMSPSDAKELAGLVTKQSNREVEVTKQF